MAEPAWVTYKESTHGVNSDGFPDIFNRAERTLWTVNFLAEHNKDGTHKAAMLSDVWGIDTGTYTGTGSGVTQEITIADATDTPQFARVFSADVAYTFFVATVNGKVYRTDSTDTGETATIATGNITVTGNLNELNRVYYYSIYSCHI